MGKNEKFSLKKKKGYKKEPNAYYYNWNMQQ